MKKSFQKYFLSILLLGICTQLTANTIENLSSDISNGIRTEKGTTNSNGEIFIAAGINSSSSEKHHTSKVEFADEQEEEEENEPTLTEKQIERYSYADIFARFCKTGYFFHLIKDHSTKYRNFTYLSTYKALHLMFNVLQL